MYTKFLVPNLLYCFAILGIVAGPGLAEELALDPTLTFSVTPLVNDPHTSEVVIEIVNVEPGEIWNVNVRLGSGYLGICPRVFQVGRIPVGGAEQVRSTCVGADSEHSGELIWRIDFDSEAGHRQLFTTGFDNSEDVAGGQ